MLTTEEKQAIIKEHARHEGDTGSPEVWSASWPAELSAEKRHRTVSRNYCQTEYP